MRPVTHLYLNTGIMDKSSKNSSPEKRLSPPKRDDAPGAYGVQPGPKSWAIVADEALGGQPRDSMSQTYSDAIMSWNASVINDQVSLPLQLLEIS